MTGGPVVLLGQGEQYDDPDDWRELIRARRIRRGVELAVRRDGLTSLHRPEEVPELAAVLDAVEPPLPPESAAAPAGSPPPLVALAAAPSIGASAATPPPPAALPPAGPPPPRAGLPTARPKRGRFPVWPLLIGVGVLLLLRFCGADGFGPLPGFGDHAGHAIGDARGAAAPKECAHPRGWLAKAACDDPDLARLRPALIHAYSARAAGLGPDARDVLADEQARWQSSREACRRAADPGACLEPRYRRRIAELESPR